MKNNLTLLSAANRYCVFNSETLDIFSLNEFTFSVIRSYLNSENKPEVCRQYNISIPDLDRILSLLKYKTGMSSSGDCIFTTYKNISRITVHVSNDCNLRCKYCYAEGGNYHKERQLMTTTTANQLVEYCCNSFNKIDNIVFFGGEPFLNIDIMTQICEAFKENFNKGYINYLPRFGAITNGTIRTNKALSLIRKHFSFLTVSIDGPKEINDTNRIFKNGKGSFELIDSFLKEVKILKNVDLFIEATFTNHHLSNGYNRKAIFDYLTSTYGAKVSVVDELSMESNVMNNTANEISTDSAWFRSILEAIVNNRKLSKCEILHEIFAIDSNGGIFPCHINVGDGMEAVSSIWESAVKVRKILQETTDYNLKNNSTCKDCWAESLYGGCARSTFYDKNLQRYNNFPNNQKCELFRNIAAKTILKICELKSDPKKWQKLLDDLKKPNPYT